MKGNLHFLTVAFMLYYNYPVLFLNIIMVPTVQIVFFLKNLFIPAFEESF